MKSVTKDDQISVIGAGTMGAGIAQVAATAGHPVVLCDVVTGVAEGGLASIREGMEKLIPRGKFTQDRVDEICARITTSDQIDSVRGSAVVIEAIIEDEDIKKQVFAQIESVCPAETIIASNTSSISISALASEMNHPQRLVGMHFFNPAVVMKLVEVVSGLGTSNDVANAVADLATTWGKKPVHATSTPGFIVNRVARPYYAEALRSLTEKVADVQTIDLLFRSCGGFRMGPLELTDLIGQDVNAAVTESVYRAFYEDKKFQPSVLQRDMVSAGLLGRKSGVGFYDYSAESPAAIIESPVQGSADHVSSSLVGSFAGTESLDRLVRSGDSVVVETSTAEAYIEVGQARIQLTDGRTATQRGQEQATPNLILVDLASDYETSGVVAIAAAATATPEALLDVVGFFQTLGKDVCVIKDVPAMLVMRTVVMLINEAADAVDQGVCSSIGVDEAMQFGVAYPRGLLGWGDELGAGRVVRTLANIQNAYGEERYRCSPLLLRNQFSGRSLMEETA